MNAPAVLAQQQPLMFGSVCSGIEAASVAWEPLGWRAAFLSEIASFPKAVLRHRFPRVPLRGDFTAIMAGDHDPIDVLVGGTPCQSFSVAGLRGGLGDARGNLALGYALLAARLAPRWVVWENVPGVLSSNRGRDFGSIVGALEGLGYGLAWRTLDAQHFGVPQRRRRVFLVGYLGDWRPAAAVLFERESLRGDRVPRDAAGLPVAGADPASDGRDDGAPRVARTLTAHSFRSDAETDNLLPVAFEPQLAVSGPPTLCASVGGAPPLRTTMVPAIAFCSNDHANGGGQVAVAISQSQDRVVRAHDIVPRLCTAGGIPGQGYAAVAVSLRGREGGVAAEHGGDVSFALRASQGGGANAMVATYDAVRRLTPRECERLQGFPDDWTLVPYRGGKPAADGPRYKAIGNSMAVPVMRWIGDRIAMVDGIVRATNRCAA